MVKALSFKGDKKPLKTKKRKYAALDAADEDQQEVDAVVEDDDSWVSAKAPSDLSGPIIVVLPSEPATCIACDANGIVFASEIENIVENNPSTAEPHDVRQVWVANRVAGTAEGLISLKGHHGKYLSVDKFGIPSATREAITAEEQFLILTSPETPGTFNIQTQRDKFLTISVPSVSKSSKSAKLESVDIRGDAETIDFKNTLRIRMQARFKPRNKANKEQKAKEKISRKELEEAVGRRLEDDEVKRLKKARREGNYHEAILDVRVKGKHDKFAS